MPVKRSCCAACSVRSFHFSAVAIFQMFRWKVLKYLTAFLPAVSFLLTPFSEPLKKQVLNKNDLRWYRLSDSTNRVDRIAIRNSGDNPLSKIQIEVALQSTSSDSVS